MLFFILLFGYIFFMLSHPFHKAVSLVFLALSVGVSLFFMGGSPWFGVILSLVFAGGIMVLFTYSSSFSSSHMSSSNSIPIWLLYFFFVFESPSQFYESDFSWLGNFILFWSLPPLLLVMFMIVKLLLWPLQPMKTLN